MNLKYNWLLLTLLALSIAGCRDELDSGMDDMGEAVKTTHIAVVFNLPQNATTLSLSVDAAEDDRNGVWIDLNGDGKYAGDGSEDIRLFNEYGEYVVKSATVTVYGKVTYVGCAANGITAINTLRNPYLTTLNAPFNALQAVDLSRNPALFQLDVSGNKITSLNLSANRALGSLWVFGNQLEALDLSNNLDLTILDCSSNALASLDVSQHQKLTGLICFNNKLTSLEVHKDAPVQKLWAYGNPLTKTAADKLTALQNMSPEIDLWVEN